jgi:hypothetical protein
VQAKTRGPRHRRRGEPRWPGVIATIVAVLLYTVLPTRLLVGPRFVVPVLEGLLLIPLIAINPRRMTRETRWSRLLSLLLVLVILVANLVALGLLVNALIESKVQEGKQLLVAALQVWLTNIIVFGLAYWELDRGGPVSRGQLPRHKLPAADFRFPQDEDHDAIEEVARNSSERADWVPTLVDYLYVSVTNSSAFSPTDTMPLSPRAKALMAIEATAALMTSLLVIARGVSILS